MNIILWILLGALVGWVASLIAGTDKRFGAIGNIAVGIAGAMLGGFIVQLFGGEGVTLGEFNFYSLLVAVGGSILLIWLIRAFRRNVASYR